MKELRIAAIATIITIILLISTVLAIPASAETIPEYYPKLTIVFQIEIVGDTRIVHCIDKSQNIWSFYDNKGVWKPGDIANLLMRIAGDTEEDHEITNIYWEGSIDNFKSFHFPIGNR